MQYLLTQEEYDTLKRGLNSEYQDRFDRLVQLLSVLSGQPTPEIRWQLIDIINLITLAEQQDGSWDTVFNYFGPQP